MDTGYAEHGSGQHLVEMIGLYLLGGGLAALMGAVMVFGLTGQVWSEVGISGMLLFWAGLCIAGVGYVLGRRRRR